MHPSLELTSESLRTLVQESCAFDPGRLEGSMSLEAARIVGIDRMLLFACIEQAYRIDFPADLVAAVETVDDLLYYVTVKVDQLRAPDGRDARRHRGG